MTESITRGESQAPRFATAWASLIYTLAAMTLAFPALAGKFLVTARSDQYIAGFPFRDFAAQSLRAGHGFPLWNPYLLGGLPYVAAMHGDIFYPTFLLRMILPTDVAMTWSFIIHFVLAGLFTYLFLRGYGFGFAASIVGGLAYMMGGPIAAYVSPGHDGKLYVSALFPLALMLLVRIIRDGRLWAYGAFAIVIGLAALSPHPQLLQYTLLASGAFALYLAFIDPGATELTRNERIARLGGALGAIALGLLISAVQYLPVMQYVGWSVRAKGMGGWERATSYSFPPDELINTYLPQFSGIQGNYWGRNGIHDHSEYLGVSVFVLAALAFGGSGFARHRRFIWFWTGTLIVATLWSLGGYTPFYSIIYAIVPGTKFFRAPSTMMFVMAFAMAVLATLGTQRALAGEITRRFLVGWAIVGTVVLLLGVSGALTTMATTLAGTWGRDDAAAANAGAVVWGTIRATVVLAAVLGVAIAISRSVVDTRVGAILVAAVVLIDLWSVERSYWGFSEPAKVIYASDATLDYINKQPEPGRLLALPLRPLENMRDPFIRFDAPMAHGVRLALGYHGNEIGRYADLTDAEDNPPAAVLDPHLWGVLNVRYLLTNSDSVALPTLKRVVGPVKDAAGTTVYLYENMSPAPLAWVAPIAIKAPDDAVMATLRDLRFNYSTAALFAPDASVPVAANVTTLPAPLTLAVHTTSYAPGHMTFALDQPAPAASALVVSENYYPGWTATVDGKPAPMGRADLSFMGVSLPAGAKTVELAFDSAPYHTGKAITWCAIIFSLLLTAAGAARGRKSNG